MGKTLIVARRELAAYFSTPVAYVFLVIYLSAVGAFTFYLGGFFDRGQADLRPFFDVHPWLYLFLIPAIGMRLWSEERKSGTIELLMTLPISTTQAVFGKFLAAWLFTALALALTFPLVIGLSLVGLVMVFGSLRLADLAVAQDATLRLSMILEGMGVRPPGWLEAMSLGLPRWGLLLQPLGFGLCLVGVLGIWQTGPLGSAADVPHSGALRFLRLAGLAVTASLLTTLFLGGWTIPWWPTASIVTGISPLLGTAVATIVCMALHVTAFAGKALAMVWLHLRLEQRLPEFRYGRVLRMYWQILLPLALANILATALALSSLERLRG